MSEKITLKKGGKLVETYWLYDEEKEEGQYLERDLTSKTFLPTHILFEKKCELEEGLILKDVFLYLNSNLDYWNALLQNWCDEVVTEGLSNKTREKIDDDLEITYLQLYWNDEIDIWDGGSEFQTASRMDFVARGIQHCDDNFEGGVKKGDEINISLSFVPVYELSNFPLKLNTKYIVWETDYVTYKESRKVVEVDHNYPNLFEILYGIIWELSFYGGPSSREEKAKELKNAVKEIKEGTAKLVPQDEIIKKINTKTCITLDNNEKNKQ